MPDAPTSVVAVAGNAQATVSFAVPADGGSPITGYRVVARPAAGPDVVVTTAASPVTVTGLTNGVVYTFAVVAINAAGDSATSPPSAGAMPFDPAVTPTTAVHRIPVLSPWALGLLGLAMGAAIVFRRARRLGGSVRQ